MGKHPIPGSAIAASVAIVSTPLPDLPRFVVEWYSPDTTVEALAERVGTITTHADRGADDAVVALLTTWLLPSDEVVFGLFAASSSESVAQLCRLAGYPAGRVSVAVEAGHPRGGGLPAR